MSATWSAAKGAEDILRVGGAPQEDMITVDGTMRVVDLVRAFMRRRKLDDWLKVCIDLVGAGQDPGRAGCHSGGSTHFVVLSCTSTRPLGHSARGPVAMQRSAQVVIGVRRPVFECGLLLTGILNCVRLPWSAPTLQTETDKRAKAPTRMPSGGDEGEEDFEAQMDAILADADSLTGPNGGGGGPFSSSWKPGGLGRRPSSGFGRQLHGGGTGGISAGARLPRHQRDGGSGEGDGLASPTSPLQYGMDGSAGSGGGDSVPADAARQVPAAPRAPKARRQSVLLQQLAHEKDEFAAASLLKGDLMDDLKDVLGSLPPATPTTTRGAGGGGFGGHDGAGGRGGTRGARQSTQGEGTLGLSAVSPGGADRDGVASPGPQRSGPSNTNGGSTSSNARQWRSSASQQARHASSGGTYSRASSEFAPPQHGMSGGGGASGAVGYGGDAGAAMAAPPAHARTDSRLPSNASGASVKQVRIVCAGKRWEGHTM